MLCNEVSEIYVSCMSDLFYILCFSELQQMQPNMLLRCNKKVMLVV